MIIVPQHHHLCRVPGQQSINTTEKASGCTSTLQIQSDMKLQQTLVIVHFLLCTRVIFLTVTLKWRAVTNPVSVCDLMTLWWDTLSRTKMLPDLVFRPASTEQLSWFCGLLHYFLNVTRHRRTVFKLWMEAFQVIRESFRRRGSRLVVWFGLLMEELFPAGVYVQFTYMKRLMIVHQDRLELM